MGKNYKADNSSISLRFSLASEFPWFLSESWLCTFKSHNRLAKKGGGKREEKI
jgi:hypothetical protein